MAKLIHVSREIVEKGFKELESLLAEDEFWQVEHQKIKQFEAQEKALRDAEHVAKQKASQVQKEALK